MVVNGHTSLAHPSLSHDLPCFIKGDAGGDRVCACPCPAAARLAALCLAAPLPLRWVPLGLSLSTPKPPLQEQF